AWPPGNPPNMCEYPKRPAGEYPIYFAAISALGLDVSQQEYSCFSQKKQCPHEIVKGTTTRSPFCRLVTALPTSTTSPIGSCPSTSPLFILGMNPSSRWRSDPQIPVAVILMIASR